ncbi:MAG: DUF4439 domain-containing protein [Propionibacteriaceae bacterium]
MTRPHAPTTVAGAHISSGAPTSRRSLLAHGLVFGMAGAGLVACSGDRPSPPPSRSSSGSGGRPSGSTGTAPASVTPTPDATTAAAARSEQRLLTLTIAALDHPDAAALSAARRRLLRAVRDGHRQHLAALRSAEPTSRPLPSASPSPTTSPSASSRPRSSLTADLTALRTAETTAVSGHRKAAASSVGFTSLLHASLAEAAQGYATALDDADPPKPITGSSRPVLIPWTESEAEQDLLAATHAMLYGYKAAVGSVSESSALGTQLLARLLDYRKLRDRLTRLVHAAGLEPAAAEPAYGLPVRVTGTASATALARRLELAVQPHLGRFVAAATTPAVHAVALSQFSDATGTALARGAGVAAWPGWPA